MRCFIKNIPSSTFGIAGNRGVGFPLTDYCSLLPRPFRDDKCNLVKEDGYTNILTEIEKELIVECVDPIDICYLVLQEDRNIDLVQQENGDVIFCSEVSRELPEENCYLVLQEDGVTSIADQEYRDHIYTNCEEAFLYLAVQEDGVTPVADQEYREQIFVERE